MKETNGCTGNGRTGVCRGDPDERTHRLDRTKWLQEREEQRGAGETNQNQTDPSLSRVQKNPDNGVTAFQLMVLAAAEDGGTLVWGSGMLMGGAQHHQADGLGVGSGLWGCGAPSWERAPGWARC